MDLDGFDNRVNFRVESAIPDICKEEPCCLGIDEAGRGPVLGPMVYGICFCPLSKTKLLNSLGFADSKTLSEEQRDSLFDKINESSDTIGWIVNILAPNYISNSMLARTKYNLNDISHDTAIGLVQRAIKRGANIKEVYVDTVGDPVKYQAKLQQQFPSLDITVAKKADSTYPIVSAASICAKVTRDKVVKDWKFIEGLTPTEYGSGYPGDPKTKKFLTDSFDPIFGFSQFVRFGWSTASVIIDKEAIAVHWEDDDKDDDGGKSWNDIKSVPITSFFQPAVAKKHKSDAADVIVPATPPHRFFTERGLQRTIDL